MNPHSVFAEDKRRQHRAGFARGHDAVCWECWGSLVRAGMWRHVWENRGQNQSGGMESSWPFFYLCTFHYKHILPLSSAPSPLTFPSSTPSFTSLLRSCSGLEGAIFSVCSSTFDLFCDWQPRCYPGTVAKERSFLHFQC